MASMLGRLIGTIVIILSPTRKPKLAYFICTLFSTLFALILVLPHYVPAWSHFLFLIALTLIGIIRFCHALPYFVTYYNINGTENPTLMVLWQALGIVGIAWGLLIDSFSTD